MRGRRTVDGAVAEAAGEAPGEEARQAATCASAQELSKGSEANDRTRGLTAGVLAAGTAHAGLPLAGGEVLVWILLVGLAAAQTHPCLSDSTHESVRRQARQQCWVSSQLESTRSSSTSRHALTG